MPEGSEPISFARAIIRIPAGTQVGNEFPAKGSKGAKPIYWKINLSFSDDELNLTAIDEIEKYGYTALGADQVLFGTSARSKPRFLLGAVITELAHNRYMPEAGNFSSTFMAVEWQLYDNELGKTVFKAKTRATIRKKNDLSTGTIFLSFAKSLDDLLTQKEFAVLVAKRTKSVIPPKQQGGTLVCPCTSSGILSLPENLERALEAIAVVKTGGSVGTGVIISREGFILTAHHVVQDAEEVWAEMKSGLSLEATIVRFDAEYDLALLKLTGKGHACLPLRTGSRPAIGEEVFAVGTPAGVYDFSVSKGVISAVREMGGGKTLLQTDASVNSGNSGGPLLDKFGRVVGIVTWKLRPDQGYEGIAFAVPADAAIKRLNLIWERQ
jgi:S1-C subfamily serine protease